MDVLVTSNSSDSGGYKFLGTIPGSQKSEEETSEEHRIVKKRITFWKRQQHVGAEC